MKTRKLDVVDEGNNAQISMLLLHIMLAMVIFRNYCED